MKNLIRLIHYLFRASSVPKIGFQAIIVLIFATTSPMFAQWVETNGLFNGESYCFTSDASNTFVGTYGAGVLKSTDNGTSWLSSNYLLSNLDVRSILKYGVLYAGTNGDGILRSDNDGGSWVQKNSGLTNLKVYSLNVHTSGLLFSGTDDGIFRSYDAGENWSASNVGLTNTHIRDIESNGVNTVLAATPTGVFLSTDNGDTWSEVNNGLTHPNVYTLCGIGANTIFAGTDWGVFKSTNNGINWSEVNNGGLSGTIVLSLSEDGSYIYAGTYNGGVYRSNNNGSSWAQVNSGLSNLIVRGLYNSGGFLFAATAGGLFRSNNNGSSWVEINNGLKNPAARNVVASGLKVLVSTSIGPFVSLNNGQNWVSTSNTGLKVSDIRSGAIGNGYYFAGTGPTGVANFYSGVYRSNNNGTSWTQVLGETPAYDLIFSTGNLNLYAACGTEAIYRSSNNGTNWTAVNTGLPQGFRVDKLGAKGSFIFATLRGKGVYRLPDNGTTWAAVNTNLPLGSSTTSYSLTSNDTYIYAGNSDAGLYRSSDDGNNWSSSGLASRSIRGLTTRGSDIFAVTNAGVFVSNDNGSTWLMVNDGLPVTDAYSIAASSTNLFVGINTNFQSLWKRPLSQLTGVEDNKNNTPEAYLLSQNYPNPFNPTTTINYSVPELSNVVIKVYDVLGKEVTTLINEEKPVGSYEVGFDSKGLSSGIYFYKIQAGNYVKTKKMILMK